MKLKLTKREVAAVKASIKHWQRDMQKPLREGRKIGIGWLWDDGTKIKDTDVHCSLCQLVGLGDDDLLDCPSCPYYKRWGFACIDDECGHWWKWSVNRSLRTCNAMIRALEKILED